MIILFSQDSLSNTDKEREDELTQMTLVALNDMRIKFPGKSDEEAEYILDKVNTGNIGIFYHSTIIHVCGSPPGVNDG